MRITSVTAIALAAVACQPGATAPTDGVLTARVDRTAGTVLVTNSRSESVLVGLIGRGAAAAALLPPCGQVRVAPKGTASFDIPSRETEAIVFYCALPLPSNGDLPTQQSVIVALDK